MAFRLGLAALSGLLTYFAFPSVGAWPLAFVAWAPLLLALRGETPKRAAAIGLFAGLFATLPAFQFLYPVLRNESGLGAFWVALIVLLVALYHALRGLFVGVSAQFLAKGTHVSTVGFVAGLVASELLIPSLFPWYFANCVHSVPLFVQPAELVGPTGVSAILGLSSIALAETIAAWSEHRRARPWVMVVSLGVPICAAFWSSIRIPQIDALAASSPSSKAAIVQPNLARGGEVEILSVHREATEDLRTQGADFVVWAEGALPWVVPASLAEPTFEMLRLPDVPLLTGAIVQNDPQNEKRGRVANSALFFDQKKLVGRYDKHHLLPFSETLPFEKELPWLRTLSPHSGDFEPGVHVSPTHFRDHTVAVFICYEDLFPSHVRKLNQNGDVDLLINLTNDSWFMGTFEPTVHLALAKMRAVEQRKYLVRATLTGQSAVIDPVGRVVGTIADNERGTLARDIRWMRETTLYARWGDLPAYLFVVLSAAYLVAKRRTLNG
ncbi:MAG: apolipoprotein N-acyltransferase [Polyangiaceae bacterium]|nr:apolipoprotein N-acyltransferase [Polyangiaceae bacterium]